MLNELWAKVSANEKFEVYGAVAVVVGWLVGLILGTSTYVFVTVNAFSWGTAGLTVILAVAAAVAAAIVIYLKVAPSSNITWPMPVSQILLGLGVAALVLAILTALFNITQGPPLYSTGLFVYVADAILIVGGALMAYGAYREWTASK